MAIPQKYLNSQLLILLFRSFCYKAVMRNASVIFGIYVLAFLVVAQN